MGKIEKISGYRTTDGRVFDVMSDALNHQKIIDFDAWYNRTPLHLTSAKEMRVYLITNREIVKNFLESEL